MSSESSKEPTSMTLPEQVVASAENPLTPNPVAISPVSTVLGVVPNPAPAVTESYSGHPVGGYPVILNSDHAEFEAEWSGKNPKDRPDWPLPSFDAHDWAESFTSIMKGKIMIKKDDAIDTMRGWFANALMRGFDEASARAAKEFATFSQSVAEDREALQKRLESEKEALQNRLKEQKESLSKGFELNLESFKKDFESQKKLLWAKYGGVFVAGVAVGTMFADYFRS